MNINELSSEDLKNIKRAFTVFIAKVIKHAAIDFARKEKIRLSRIVSLTEYTNKGMSLSILDNGIFSLQECENYKELHKIMTNEKHQKAITKLSNREKEIIYFLYIEELTLEEIASKLKLTSKTIRNTKNNALKKLKKDMEE